MQRTSRACNKFIKILTFNGIEFVAPRQTIP
jgi:hypothetical protein